MSCDACDRGPLNLKLRVARELDERGLIPTTDAFGTALGDISECAICGHRQLEPMPSDDDLLKLYIGARADHYIEEARGQAVTARSSLDHIERYVKVGRFLDLGCWVGFMLVEARGRGWDVTGVEPSEFAAAYARDHFNLDILEADLFGADLPARSFDAIVLGDVIEHLTDPFGALEHIAELLAPSGILYLTLPDSGSRLARAMGERWWGIIPTHVQYFSRHSLSLLLRRAGYDVLDVTTAPKTFSISYYANRLTGYSPLMAKTVDGAMKLLRIADGLWTPDFRDRMAVVARAPV